MAAPYTIPRDEPSGEAGQQLYLAVRAGLTARGSSLNKWCIANGVSRQWACQALTGKEHGPAARHLAQRLKRAAGVSS